MIPKKSMENLFKKDWHNKRCVTVILEREMAWSKWRNKKEMTCDTRSMRKTWKKI